MDTAQRFDMEIREQSTGGIVVPTEIILQLRLTDQRGNYLNDARICLTLKNGKKIEVKTDWRGLASLKVPIN